MHTNYSTISIIVNFFFFFSFFFFKGGGGTPPRAAAGMRFKFTEELWDLEARVSSSAQRLHLYLFYLSTLALQPNRAKPSSEYSGFCSRLTVPAC